MKISVRCYDHASDYERVNRLLIRTYGTSPGHINWLQPRWEYMHYTSGIVNVDLSAIGVWESEGEIVAVVHPEHFVGRVFFEIEPDYGFLKREMLAHAEGHLYGATEDGRRRLGIHINDQDEEFQSVAAQMGYGKSEWSATMLHYPIPEPFPAISLPEGFALRSVADGRDIEQLAMAIWRGFDHVDDPPANNIEWRRRMEAAPNFRPDLTIMVELETEVSRRTAACGMSP